MLGEDTSGDLGDHRKGSADHVTLVHLPIRQFMMAIFVSRYASPCTILDSHSHGYEDFCFLRYNIV
jgi:hypothetical protein